jgi:A/G-specific adenine glycosylase
MLQQTQVARVLPKYKEFLEAFPSLRILARAKTNRVLQVWSGLGYWRRALYIQETAKKILKERGGKFPKHAKLLETCPGIGRYTARAIACFAFGNAEAFLDTNIRRVYLYFFFQNKHNVLDKEILPIAQKALTSIPNSCLKLMYPFVTPKEWHYALFDYGATVLKDKKINKRSKHYTKQSKFEGSFRSFRAKVLRFLLDRPNQTATRNKIHLLLKKANSPYASESILMSLEKDGLIKKKNLIELSLP